MFTVACCHGSRLPGRLLLFRWFITTAIGLFVFVLLCSLHVRVSVGHTLIKQMSEGECDLWNEHLTETKFTVSKARTIVQDLKRSWVPTKHTLQLVIMKYICHCQYSSKLIVMWFYLSGRTFDCRSRAHRFESRPVCCFGGKRLLNEHFIMLLGSDLHVSP